MTAARPSDRARELAARSRRRHARLRGVGPRARRTPAHHRGRCAALAVGRAARDRRTILVAPDRAAVEYLARLDATAATPALRPHKEGVSPARRLDALRSDCGLWRRSTTGTCQTQSWARCPLIGRLIACSTPSAAGTRDRPVAHQPRTIAATREAYRGARGASSSCCPRGGKTRLGRHYVNVYAGRGQRALGRPPGGAVAQAAATLAKWAPSVCSRPTTTSGDAPVVVASVQTLAARGVGRLAAADLVILDEAHHYVAAQWGAVARAYSEALTSGSLRLRRGPTARRSATSSTTSSSAPRCGSSSAWAFLPRRGDRPAEAHRRPGNDARGGPRAPPWDSPRWCSARRSLRPANSRRPCPAAYVDGGQHLRDRAAALAVSRRARSTC